MSMLFLAIPLTLFVLFVLPVWLWLHYNNRGANGSLTQNEQQRLLQLTDDAKRRQRVSWPGERQRGAGAVAESAGGAGARSLWTKTLCG